MLSSRLKVLAEELNSGEFKTAGQLAKCCGISEKTARVRLKELGELLEENGARIISKKGSGYRLEIEDSEKYISLLTEKDGQIPVSTADRIQYIMAMFLNQRDYIKKEKICEFLFISERTMTTEIKKMENIFSKYGLSIERKPFYGMKLEGKEFDRRRCMLDYLVVPEYHALGDREIQKKEVVMTGEQILSVVNRNHFDFSEMSFKNLVDYVYIAVKRIKKGFCVETEQDLLEQAEGRREYKTAEELSRTLEKLYQIRISPMETFYIGIYIAGKSMVGGSSVSKNNFIIEESMDRMVYEMLQEVYEIFHLDFRNDFNLRMLLNQHMIPFDVRMTYGIPIENPLLEEVKTKYVFAFSVAQQACIPLQRHYRQKISEDEISYFAILFTVALEHQGHTIEKKSVLLVCVNGKASSQLLLYRFKKEFGEYIDKIFISNLYDIDQFDFRKVDYVFTTVPLNIPVNVPAMQIHDFLEGEDLSRVRNQFLFGDMSWIPEYYREEMFFTGVKGRNKEEVMAEICQKIREVRDLPEGFYESVLEREKMGNTDYGNLCAIPHPSSRLLSDNLVCVGILEHPILWVKNQVQMVVLVSVADSKNEDTQKFYEATAKLLMDKEKVEEILANPSYEAFIKRL